MVEKVARTQYLAFSKTKTKHNTFIPKNPNLKEIKEFQRELEKKNYVTGCVRKLSKLANCKNRKCCIQKFF